MPGTLTFKPIEANLTHNTDILGKMNPLCSFVIGHEKHDSQPCIKGGKHPHWNDSVSVHVTESDPQVKLHLVDKAMLFHDDTIGSCFINLKDLEAQRQSRSWYPLTFKNESAGYILVETTYQPDKGETLEKEGTKKTMGSQQGELKGDWKDTEMMNQQGGFNKKQMGGDMEEKLPEIHKVKSVEEGTKYEEVYDHYRDNAGFAYESKMREQAGLPPLKELHFQQTGEGEGMKKEGISGSLEYQEKKTRQRI